MKKSTLLLGGLALVGVVVGAVILSHRSSALPAAPAVAPTPDPAPAPVDHTAQDWATVIGAVAAGVKTVGSTFSVGTPDTPAGTKT